MKFRVLRGSHNEDGRTYRPGEVVDSKTDLAKRFNHPGALKFEKVTDDAPVGAQPTVKEDFQAMSVADLQAYAKEAGINLAGAKRKEDIITLLEEALDG